MNMYANSHAQQPSLRFQQLPKQHFDEPSSLSSNLVSLLELLRALHVLCGLGTWNKIDYARKQELATSLVWFERVKQSSSQTG
jgi:hypothetical protein